jgi:hypothetical protein
MVDTVRLRPEVRYSITPTAWQTVFETPKYAPAQLSIAPFTKNRPLYVRAGVGYPLQSTADLYYNPYMGDRSTFGLWLNHRGSYSRIENDLGLKPRSTEMLNEAGLYGSKLLGRRRLEGSLSYDNRLYNAYGVAATPDIGITPSAGLTTYSFAEIPAIKLGYIDGRLAFGDTFTDLSRLNFAASFNLGVAHQRSSFYQLDLDGWFKIGKMYGHQGFEVGVLERGAITFESWGGRSVAVRLSPDYLLSLDKFNLRAGVDISFINSTDDDFAHWVLSPRLSATYNMADGAFVPFATLSSELLDNSQQALVRRNPYAEDSAATGWTHDGRIGFSGTLSDRFSYRLWGGVSWLRNQAFFVGIQKGTHIEEDVNDSYIFDPLVFSPVTDNGTLYTAGTELGLNNLGGFSATLHANAYKYKLEEFAFAPGMPSWDAGLKLAYERRRFAVRAGVDILGKRKFLDYNYLVKYIATPFDSFVSVDETAQTVTTLSSTINISLGVEYNLSEDFGLFVEGRNLANQKLYPYGHYAGLGANLMLGIKATF